MKHSLIYAAVLAALLPAMATVSYAADQDQTRDRDRLETPDQTRDQDRLQRQGSAPGQTGLRLAADDFAGAH